MIEYCSKKIMMTTIGGLIFICVLILYLEDSLIEHPAAVVNTDQLPAAAGGSQPLATVQSSAQSDATGAIAAGNRTAAAAAAACRPIGDCVSCSQFESRMSNANLSPYCVSGYKQRLACPGGGGEHFAPCGNATQTVTAFERGKYFLFQALCLLALLLSGTVVQRRQRVLNQIFAEKITRQVASGV